MGYARAPIRDFESYLRNVVGLNEDDVQLISKQYISNFVTFEIPPGIYPIKDLQEPVHPLIDHEGTLKYEYDNNSEKTKVISKRFGGTFGMLRFDEIGFLRHYRSSTILGL